MSWFGLARRISHWVLGGRNASHVAPLPIQVVGVEFAKVDNYMKAKVAELPRDNNHSLNSFGRHSVNSGMIFKNFDLRTFHNSLQNLKD